MGTIDKLKERLEHKDYIGKPCPICGAAPKIVSVDLGRPGGHGYPDCVDIHLECSGCGIIKADSYNTIYNKDAEAENKAIKDWNEVVDYVNELIAKPNKKYNEVNNYGKRISKNRKHI